jgi:hypothetical protein
MVSSTPSITLPYSFLPSPIIQQLSVHVITSSTCTDVIYFNYVECLS